MVTSKESKGRRGFIFVTFTSVDAVDELVKEQYHYIPYRQDGEQKDHRVGGAGGGAASREAVLA